MIWLIFTEHFVSGKEAYQYWTCFVIVLVFFMYFVKAILTFD